MQRGCPRLEQSYFRVTFDDVHMITLLSKTFAKRSETKVIDVPNVPDILDVRDVPVVLNPASRKENAADSPIRAPCFLTPHVAKFTRCSSKIESTLKGKAKRRRAEAEAEKVALRNDAAAAATAR